MIEILKGAIQRGASDIHVKAGDFIRARIRGELIPITKQQVPPDQTRQLASQLVPEWEKKNIDKLRDYDCSWGAPGVGRFLSLIHISEPTRRTPISYAVFC